MKLLLPERHKNQDFFIADFGDVIPKSDIASMEHPLFTLSTKPDTKIRYYEHNGNSVQITPSVLGLATIYDKDILIYCISQLMKGVNENIELAKFQGKEHFNHPSKKIHFTAHDLLVSTNREVSGNGYLRLEQAFDRLNGTMIQTNIKTNKQEINEKFHILESVKTIYDNPDSPRRKMIRIEVELSQWLYNSVLGQEVLSINRDYFRIRKPLERRIYEIARKHCGNKHQWKIGLDTLLKKSGSASSKAEFKRMLNHIVEHDHLPDYKISIEKHNVVFYAKNHQQVLNSPHLNSLFLRSDTIENAKKIIRPLGLDVYALQEEWLEFWRNSGEQELTSPDGAFINFCKKKVG